MCHVREGVGPVVGRLFRDNIRRVVDKAHNTFFWTDNWLGRVPLKLQLSRLYELSVHKSCSVEDMARLGWEEGGNGWGWRRHLLAWEEESVLLCWIPLFSRIIFSPLALVTRSYSWLLGSWDLPFPNNYRITSGRWFKQRRVAQTSSYKSFTFCLASPSR